MKAIKFCMSTKYIENKLPLLPSGIELTGYRQAQRATIHYVIAAM